VRAALRWTLGLVLGLLVGLALFVAFGLNLLRAPLERAVTEATGRELRIEGDLRPVWSWVHPRFRAEKVSFANPDWASVPKMLAADAVEISISLLPLLDGRVVLPQVHLLGAELHLQRDAQGRSNWPLEGVVVEHLSAEGGRLKYDDARRDIHVAMPLSSDVARELLAEATSSTRSAASGGTGQHPPSRSSH
jgi:uncharacterized protein involved in outer membrane biogenesis